MILSICWGFFGFKFVFYEFEHHKEQNILIETLVGSFSSSIYSFELKIKLKKKLSKEYLKIEIILVLASEKQKRDEHNSNLKNL